MLDYDLREGEGEILLISALLGNQTIFLSPLFTAMPVPNPSVTSVALTSQQLSLQCLLTFRFPAAWMITFQLVVHHATAEWMVLSAPVWHWVTHLPGLTCWQDEPISTALMLTSFGELAARLHVPYYKSIQPPGNGKNSILSLSLYKYGAIAAGKASKGTLQEHSVTNSTTAFITKLSSHSTYKTS